MRPNANIPATAEASNSTLGTGRTAYVENRKAVVNA